MLEIHWEPSTSRSPRDLHRRSNELDRGYHQQQQQRTLYDLDPVNFHLPERNPSPPELASGSSSGGTGGS